MINCDECKPLMMGLMDNELTTDETVNVNEHFIRCESCRKEYDELVKNSKMLKGISFKEPEDEILEKLWKNPFSIFTQWSGILLVIAGYLVLIGYGIYEFIQDRGEASLPKIALLAVVTGFVLLLLSVIRQRTKTYKTDRYKEVIR